MEQAGLCFCGRFRPGGTLDERGSRLLSHPRFLECPPPLKDSSERPHSQIGPLEDMEPNMAALSPSTLPVLSVSCMLISSGPFLVLLCLPLSSTPPDSGEEWSAWSVCSATCGEGWQSRTRFCVSSSYSTQCSGPLREQRPCNNSAVCPGKPLPHPVLLTCPAQLLAPPPPQPQTLPSSSSLQRLQALSVVYARLAVGSRPGGLQDPGPGRSSGQSDVLFVLLCFQ